MSFQIRTVQPGDAPVLAHIQTSSWRSAFKNIITDDDLGRLTDLGKVTAMYSRLLEEKKGHGYIGEVEGKAHCIAYWDKARDTDLSDCAEIICIHSLPDNWRRGYGSQMMDRLLSDISAAGYEKAILWVFTENQRARAFYEAKGFTATDHVKAALGTEEICYSIDL